MKREKNESAGLTEAESTGKANADLLLWRKRIAVQKVFFKDS
jgi:hypothetical protein